MALELGDDCDSNRNLDKINLKMFHVTAALLVNASLGVSEAPDCVPKQGYETMPADMGGGGGDLQLLNHLLKIPASPLN